MKLLITSILCLLIVSTQAQEKTTHSSHSNVGYWSESKKDWIWDGWRECDVDITIRSKIVIIGKRDQYIYIIGEVALKEENIAVWNATDKDNNKCYIKLRTYTAAKQMQLDIIYSDINTVYELDY